MSADPLAGVATDVLARLYWTMPVHTDAAAAKLDIISAELVARGVALRNPALVSASGHRSCENVGVCMWCDAEVGDNHLCELMCLAAGAVMTIEARRTEALS